MNDPNTPRKEPEPRTTSPKVVSHRASAVTSPPVSEGTPTQAHAPAANAAPLRTYQLVSLWDMLDQYAGRFVLLHARLRAFERELRAAESAGQGKEPIGDDRGVELAGELVSTHTRIKHLGLESTAEWILYVLEILGPSTRVKDAAELVCGVADRMVADLGRFYLLHVPKSNVGLYSEPLEGWGLVIDAFPDTEFDISEAGKCLALDRPTACVFHLMRVAELGLQAIAKRLHVTTKHPVEYEQMQTILSAIDAKLDEMRQRPRAEVGRTEAIEHYVELRQDFAGIKDAWRNHVAHARARYDVHRATSIYNYVRSLMERSCADPEHPADTEGTMSDEASEKDEKRPARFMRTRAPEPEPDEPLPYPDSDIPPALQRTIHRKIREGREEVDEEQFRDAVDRAVRKRPD